MHTIESPYLLLVEGNDEVQFFTKLIADLDFQDIQVQCVGGKENFRKLFKAVTKMRGFTKVRAMGIIRDSNSDPRAAFQSICSGLENAGFPRPSSPSEIISDDTHDIKIAIKLIPESDRTGELEDVCLEAIHDSPEMECVDAFVACLKDKGVNPEKLAKTKMQLFIASKGKADYHRLGTAAQRGYLPLEHKAFSSLKEFLTNLLSL